jgi:predicted nucleotidyltransferase
MTSAPVLRDRDLAAVRQTLRAFLPSGATVRVFGSRARGAARPGSDLDLAIDAGRPLTRQESGALEEAFEELSLPFRVDLVDVHAASEGFVALISQDWTPLEETPDQRPARMPG